MSSESLDQDVDVLLLPLLEEHPVKHGRQETFRRESLIATLCFCPIGIIALFYSAEVNRLNNNRNFNKAYKASKRTECLVLNTYRVSVVFYLILAILLGLLIMTGILFGIETVHTLNY